MSGRLFTANSLVEILANPIVVGTLSHRVGKIDATAERGAEPIVSAELWDRAQRRRREQTSVGFKPGATRRTYVFARVARCADCGAPFFARTVQRKGVPHRSELHESRPWR